MVKLELFFCTFLQRPGNICAMQKSLLIFKLMVFRLFLFVILMKSQLFSSTSFSFFSNANLPGNSRTDPRTAANIFVFIHLIDNSIFTCVNNITVVAGGQLPRRQFEEKKNLISALHQNLSRAKQI